MRRIKLLAGNTAWQMFPAIASLLLALIVTHISGIAFWGKIVPIIAWQQIANAIISWGNKDYLQRVAAESPAGFAAAFTTMFKLRFLILAAVLFIVYLLALVPIEVFWAFSLLVFGRFAQQSFDIVIIRERRIKLALSLEIITLFAQLFVVMVFEPGITGFFLTLALSYNIKALFLTSVFARHFSWLKSGASLRGSLNFALLGMTGMLHSRIDLLVLQAFLPAATLGKYQVVMTFLWTIQSLAMAVSGPFVHNFYRLNLNSKRTFARRLKQIGFLIVPVCIAVMFLVLVFAFGIEPKFFLAIPFAIFGAMSFFYLPSVFELNRRKKENRVLAVNILGTILFALSIVTVAHLAELTFEILFWLAAAHQVIVALMFNYLAKPQT